MFTNLPCSGKGSFIKLRLTVAISLAQLVGSTLEFIQDSH